MILQSKVRSMRFLASVLTALAIWPACALGQTASHSDSGKKTPPEFQCGGKGPDTDLDRLSSGERPSIPLSDTLRVSLIRGVLAGDSTERFACVRKWLFGETYTPRLTDWIVYIDLTKETVHQGWTLKNKYKSLPIFRGAKAVFVELFVDHVPEPDSSSSQPGSGPPPVLAETLSKGAPVRSAIDSVIREVLSSLTDSVNQERIGELRDVLAGKSKSVGPGMPTAELRRDVLQVEPDPFLARLISGFGRVLNVTTPEATQQKALSDTSWTLPLVDLGSDGSGSRDHLYFALAKVPVGGDMWGRLSIDSLKLGPPRMGTVLTNFVTTASKSAFAVSLGIGAITSTRVAGVATAAFARTDTVFAGIDTIPIPPDSFRVDTIMKRVRADTVRTYRRRSQGGTIVADSYVLLHVRILSRRPWPTRYAGGYIPFEALSLFTGTNLGLGGQKIGDHIPFGVSLERLWNSDINLSIGVLELPHSTFVADTLPPTVKHVWRPFFAFTFGL
jgi:hypothetical protein